MRVPILHRLAAVLVAFAPLVAVAAAEAPKTYRFGSHPARTNITFVSEADLETIHGWTNSISGEVVWDPDTKTASGTLKVPVKSMRTGIDTRDAHLRGEQGGVWLEAAKFPEIVFAVDKATPSSAKGEEGVFDYEGKITIHGVTKDWKGKARVRFIAADVAEKAKLGPGDWVRVTADMDVRIADFGVQIPEGVGQKVSEVWKVRIDAYGTTAPPAPPAR